MKLSFLGACREVGRSSFLLNTGGMKILLDAGIKLFDHNEFPALEEKPDAIIISHSHMDHIGFLPVVYKHSSPPCYCTYPTAPITGLLLEDSEKIAKARSQNPFFTKQDFKKMNKRMIQLPYKQEHQFFDGTRFEFVDAGHIIGSAQAMITNRKKRILYSGDIKLDETQSHRGLEIPEQTPQALIMESTYATSDHPPRQQLERELCDAVKDCLDSGKHALLPAFAVGRTQELIQILYRNLANEDCFLEGMGVKVNAIYSEYPSYVKNSSFLNKAFNWAQALEGRQEKKRARRNPSILVCTAGMLEGGPALGYIKNFNVNDGCKIFLTGFQVEGTNGRSLLEKGEMRIDGKKQKINLAVEFFDFSAHAGKKELLDYAKEVNPEKVFCVHGNEQNCIALAKQLSDLGFEASATKLGESVSL